MKIKNIAWLLQEHVWFDEYINILEENNYKVKIFNSSSKFIDYVLKETPHMNLIHSISTLEHTENIPEALAQINKIIPQASEYAQGTFYTLIKLKENNISEDKILLTSINSESLKLSLNDTETFKEQCEQIGNYKYYKLDKVTNFINTINNYSKK